MSKLTLGFAAVALTVAVGGNVAYQYGTVDDVAFTVDKLTTKYNRESGKDTYLVSVTHDNGQTEVFKNEDSLLHGKFDSSDVQLIDLQEGAKYEGSVYGWRIGFFSAYRNIIDVEQTASAENMETKRPAPKAPGA